jgi:hypothetical protein
MSKVDSKAPWNQLCNCLHPLKYYSPVLIALQFILLLLSVFYMTLVYIHSQILCKF